MNSKKNPNRVKEHTVRKGIREQIISQVLKEFTATKPDLMKAISGVTDRSIRRELATHRAIGIVLTVDSSTGSPSFNMTTISLNTMLAEAFLAYGDLSPGEIGKWSFVLAIADSEIRGLLKKPEPVAIDVGLVESMLRTLVESFPVGSPAEEELLKKVHSVLEGIAGIGAKDSKERPHARVDNVEFQNTDVLTRGRSFRQSKPAKRLRTASSDIQAKTDRSLPGGWLERSRRAVRKVGDIFRRRVGESVGEER